MIKYGFQIVPNFLPPNSQRDVSSNFFMKIRSLHPTDGLVQHDIITTLLFWNSTRSQNQAFSTATTMMKISLLIVACYLGIAQCFQPKSVNSHRSSSCLFYSPSDAVKAALPSPLIDANGNAIDSPESIAALVKDQRVALYFGASWCKDCRNLEFMLAQYRSALADSDQPIQLIYVPSDNTQEDQLSRMQELGLEVGVPLGETADALKKHYGVWPDVDIEKFGGISRELDVEEQVAVAAVRGSEGEKVATEAALPSDVENTRDQYGRRSGIPAFVVLDNQGAEFCFLNAERDSISVLADWPLDDPKNIW